jgi:hypothetical protein
MQQPFSAIAFDPKLFKITADVTLPVPFASIQLSDPPIIVDRLAYFICEL